MAKALGPGEIAQLAFNAGFRGDSLAIAVAVSLAESGGNPSAFGDVGLQDSTWGPSVGLWQIRSINKQRGTGQGRDQNTNTDAQTNATNAFAISGAGANFGPWSTYKNGAYKKYLTVARQVASGIKGAGNVNYADSMSSSTLPPGQQQGDDRSQLSSQLHTFNAMIGKISPAATIPTTAAGGSI